MTQAIPYQQAIHPPQQDTKVRFALPVTETKTATALARVRVWPLEGDHSLGSMEVARNWLLTPEQGETGPPPEDLKNHEEGLPVETQWITSQNSHPQVGEGT